MRALWKGAITFGLVTIPVSLFPATRREELKFRLLRSTDLSPVNYKRVAGKRETGMVTRPNVMAPFQRARIKKILPTDSAASRRLAAPISFP